MKILITGSNGSLGKYLSSYLSSNHDLYSYPREKFDITDKGLALQVITNVKPDVVIHTAALSNIDLCERNETSAYTVNTIGSLNVAYPCSLLDIPLIYISTNQVYDGNKQSPYYETDTCSPINIYGKTKLAGEKLIRTICKKLFIIRTSWIYGGENCFIRNILDNKELPVFLSSNEVANLTFIDDLCFAIERILGSDIYGIYNCVNPDPVSKLVWVRTVFDNFKMDKEIIELPENFIANKAKRPKYAALNTSLIKNCFDIELPHWQERLISYLKSFK